MLSPVALALLLADAAQGLPSLHDPDVSSGCGGPGLRPDPDFPEWYRIRIDDPLIGPTDRWFQLHMPENYNNQVPTPVVIDIHGYSSDAAEQKERTWVNRAADAETFVVVYPDGMDDAIDRSVDSKSWNSGGTASSPGPLGETCQWEPPQTAEYPCYTSCRDEAAHGCHGLLDLYGRGCDSSSCVSDVRFIAELLDAVEAGLCVNRRRIHATGFSNGAMMVYEIAQSALAERFASFAPVAGAPLVGFSRPPAVARALLDMKGDTDDTIPANISIGYRGEAGPHNSTWSSDGYYYTQTEAIMEQWAVTNSCEGRQAAYHYVTRHDGLNAFYCVCPFGQCERGGPVVRCSFEGEHTWPFYYEGNYPYFGEIIWDFFSANPRPSYSQAKPH